MTDTKHLRGLLAIAALCLALLGCQSETPDQTQSSAAGAAAVDTEQATAATNPGEVNIYSARQERLIKPLLDRFSEQTGIQVNLVTGSADAMLERLKSEGDRSPADLLVTVDAGRLHRAVEAGVTQTVDNETLNSVIPASYRDPDGHWFGLSLRARPIMYAADRVDPAQLSTYEALTDEQWRGRICIRSSGNIYNQSLAASMVAALGEDAVEDWARGMVANFARPPAGGDRDQIKAAASGQCDVVVANTYYLAGMLRSDDAEQVAAAQQMRVFWPNQSDRGTHVNVSGVALTKASPNRDNAIRLIEFLVSEPSQNWYADTNGEYPVREGVDIIETLTQWGEFKADSLNLRELGRLNGAAVMLMDRAGWQ